MKTAASKLLFYLNHLESEWLKECDAIRVDRASCDSSYNAKLKSVDAERDKSVSKANSEYDAKSRACDAEISKALQNKSDAVASIRKQASERMARCSANIKRYQDLGDQVPARLLKGYDASTAQAESIPDDKINYLMARVNDERLWATVKGIVKIDGYYSRREMAKDLRRMIDSCVLQENDQIARHKKNEREAIDAEERKEQERRGRAEKARSASRKARDEAIAKSETRAAENVSRARMQHKRNLAALADREKKCAEAYWNKVEALNLPGFVASEERKMAQLGANGKEWAEKHDFSESFPPAFPLGQCGFAANLEKEHLQGIERRLGGRMKKGVLTGFAYETFEGGEPLWVEYEGEGLRHSAGIRFLIASTARLLPYGALRVVFCDSRKKGMNLGGLNVLANDKRGPVLFSAVATTPQEVDACLVFENENLGEVGRRLPPYDNVLDYNKASKGDLIPYTLIVVNDIDDEFLSDASIETLRAITKNAGSFGYGVVVTSHPLEDVEDDKRKVLLSKLRDSFRVIKSIGGSKFRLEDGTRFRFYSDNVVTDGFLRAYADAYYAEKEKKETIVIDADIDRFYAKDGKSVFGRRRLGNADDPTVTDGVPNGISVPFGVDANNDIAYFTVGRNPDYHSLVTGAVGMGKSNFLHVIINGIASRYYPDEVQMWLMEFKGVDFAVYKDTHLPHVKLIGLSEDPDFRHSIFEKIEHEFKYRRTELFDTAGVKKIDEYNALAQKPACCSAYPEGCPEYLPHIILIIDELQVISDKFSQDEARNFAETIRLYRSHGLYLVVANQTCRPDGKPLLAGAEANVVGRIGFKNSGDQEFARLFNSDYQQSGMPSAYRLERGQAVQYQRGEYKLVQAIYMDSSTTKAVSAQCESEFGRAPLAVFEQTEGRMRFDQEGFSRRLSSYEKSGYLNCLLGKTVSLLRPLRPITIEKDLYQNFLFIGSNEELRYSAIAALALSFIEEGHSVSIVTSKRSVSHNRYYKLSRACGCDFADSGLAFQSIIEGIDSAMARRRDVAQLLIVDSGTSLFDDLEIELEMLQEKNMESIAESRVAYDGKMDESMTEKEQFEAYLRQSAQRRTLLEGASQGRVERNRAFDLERIRSVLFKFLRRGSSEGVIVCWSDSTEPEFSSKALFGYAWGMRKTSQIFAHRFITALGPQDASVARRLGFGDDVPRITARDEDKIVVYSDSLGRVAKIKPFIMPWGEKEAAR